MNCGAITWGITNEIIVNNVAQRSAFLEVVKLESAEVKVAVRIFLYAYRLLAFLCFHSEEVLDYFSIIFPFKIFLRHTKVFLVILQLFLVLTIMSWNALISEIRYWTGNLKDTLRKIELSKQCNHELRGEYRYVKICKKVSEKIYWANLYFVRSQCLKDRRL